MVPFSSEKVLFQTKRSRRTLAEPVILILDLSLEKLTAYCIQYNSHKILSTLEPLFPLLLYLYNKVCPQARKPCEASVVLL